MSKHYETESGYQHWDWVADLKLGYHLGNATKYIWRHRRKGNPAEDLKKAYHYIMKIENEYAKDSNFLCHHGHYTFERDYAMGRMRDIFTEDSFEFRICLSLLDAIRANQNITTNLRGALCYQADIILQEARKYMKWNPEATEE